MDDKELDEEKEPSITYEDQNYELSEATITETSSTRIESMNVKGKTYKEKIFLNKWFYIGVSTFLGCFYILIVIIAFLVKTTDGMNYAAGEEDDNEKYIKVYKAVEEVEQDIRSEYGVSVNKYLIISALTVFMNNHYYQNNSTGAFNYVTVDTKDGNKSTTIIKNFAEILAKYQIITNSSCSMPSNNFRQIASNDDDGMTYFTTSASLKEKNYDCNGGTGTYKVSYKQGVLDDDETGSAFYWNMLDENFFNNYYPEYFGNLSKTGDGKEQYYKAANEVLDYIYLYAKYLKSIDTKASTCTTSDYSTINIECDEVQVLANSDGVPGGSYSLEEYVSGVVAAEFDPSTMASRLSGGLAGNQVVIKEAVKAFSIAVRSYTLSKTNGCKVPISNSSSDQAFKPTNDPFILAAVKDTEGMVLVKESNVISAEYDTFYCKNTPTSCEYQKSPGDEKQTISIPADWKNFEGLEYKGDKGHGMSKLAAVWYIYDKQWKYNEALKFFYEDGVEIKKIPSSSLGDAGNVCSGGNQAKDFNALGDRAYNGDQAAIQEWIDKVGPIVQNAQHAKYGMKNSLIIAQIINESGWMHTPKTVNNDGTTLVDSCNNVIGINYDMGRIKITDQDSRWSQNPQKCFATVSQWGSDNQLVYGEEEMRRYDSIDDCIEDYANVLYLYHPECKNVNDIECYRSFLDGYTPTPAGYETVCDRYIRIISMYNLDRFDQ